MAGPVVIVVLSHRDPPLVARLVERLLEPTSTVVVSHHDPRGPRLALPTDDRLLAMPDARAADWGRLGFAVTMLDAVAFARSRVPDLSWVLLVSGQDYPCRAVGDISDELRASTHDAFVRHFRVDGDPADDIHPWQAVTRRRYLHRRRLPRTHRSVPWPRRTPFGPDLGLYVGDVWVNLGAAAVDHLMDQRRRRPEITRYFRDAPLPDEGYLATLLLNDAGPLDVVNDRRRYIQWSPGDSHPAYLTADDAAKAAAGTDFFARKLDTDSTSAALEVLDRSGNSSPNGTGRPRAT